MDSLSIYGDGPLRPVSDMEIEVGDMFWYDEEIVTVRSIERCEETTRALSVTIRFSDDELMTVHPGQLMLR